MIFIEQLKSEPSDRLIRFVVCFYEYKFTWCACVTSGLYLINVCVCVCCTRH